MTPISICTIAKNEEKHINEFISKIEDVFGQYPYELIFVDTGSTDSTFTRARIAAERNSRIRIGSFTWVDDFSAAKNYSVALASNPWILFINTDEYLNEFDLDCIDAFVSEGSSRIGMISEINHLGTFENPEIYSRFVPRLFNRSEFMFEGSIDEQLVSIVNGIYPIRVELPITVNHVGDAYSAKELRSRAQKAITVLSSMIKEDENDPYILYQLGRAYAFIGDYENAYLNYGKGLENSLNPKLEFVRRMVIGYGYSMLETSRFAEAMTYKSIYDDYKDIADFLNLMGTIYQKNGCLVDAYMEFQQALKTPYALSEGANTYVPLDNMAMINELLGNSKEAESLRQKAQEKREK